MTQEQLDFCIKSGFHKLTVYELASHCRELVDSLPKFNFEDIKPNTIIYQHKHSYGYMSSTRDVIYAVYGVTPKGGQVTVADYSFDSINPKYKLYKGTHGHYNFSELTGDMLLLIGIDHKTIIEEASGMVATEIPGKVRVEYPHLFVNIPDRFDLEEVKKVIAPDWKKYLTLADLKVWIEERHGHIRKLENTKSKIVTHSPDHVQDYEKWISEDVHRVDMYRWLMPLVDVGGTFYIGEQ